MTVGIKGFGLRKTGKMAIWSFAYILLTQMTTIGAVKASSSAPMAAKAMGFIGDISANAAQTQTLAIFVVPSSLISVSIVTALYSKLSNSVATNNLGETTKIMSFGIRTVSMFMIYFSLMFILIPIPIIKTLIPTISPSSSLLISYSLTALSLKLIPGGILLMLQRTFFSFEDAKSVFLFCIPDSLVYAFLIGMTLLFVPPPYWVAAICLSSAFSYFVGAFINFYAIKRHLPFRDGRNIINKLIRMSIAGIIMFIICSLVKVPFSINENISWSYSLLICFIISIVGAIVYATILKVLHVNELNFITKPIKNFVNSFRGK
jgi:putative peptidoglycan lipid II flippase